MPQAKAGKKRTTTKKKAAASKKLKQKVTEEKAYRTGIILVLIAVVLGAFVYFSAIGVVGGAIKSFFYGLFGLGSVFLPIIIMSLGVYSIAVKNVKGLTAKSILLFFALISVCGMLSQFSVQIVLPSTPLECFTSGQDGFGGGLFGGSLYLFLSKMTGGFVCTIILLIMLILCLSLTTHFSMFRFIGGVFRGIQENKEVFEVDYEQSYEKGKQIGTTMAKKPNFLRHLKHAKQVDFPLTDEEEKKAKLSIYNDDEDALKAEKTFEKIKEHDESLKACITNFPVYGLAQNKDSLTNEETNPYTTMDDKAPYSGNPLPKQAESAKSDECIEKNETLPIEDVTAHLKSDEFLKGLAKTAQVGENIESESILEAASPTIDDVEEETFTFDLTQEDMVNTTAPTIISKPITQAEKLNFPPAPGIASISQEEHAINQNILEETLKKQDGIPQKPILLPYTYPNVSLLEIPKSTKGASYEEEIRNNVLKLVSTLESFNVKVTPLQASRGPSVTRYELQPGPGVKVSKITGLSDDIALNLAATSVRIEAPIPGKAAIGIEVPNKKVSIVSLREVIESKEFKTSASKLSVALGMDIAGNPVVGDISKMPHVLIAGATGSGKSVCINTLITSLIYKSSPNEVKFIMIDPKVVELGIYNGIPHLLVPVVTDPAKAAGSLNWAVQEMTRRYALFAENNVRDMKGYNNYITEKFGEEYKMPNIVIIIDELADLMMVAPNDVEDAICRLAQMARAAGMHLVIATQRPSVDVITGIIKANIPSRIAFAVSSQIDSRTILDMAGAEKLLGKGDMAY